MIPETACTVLRTLEAAGYAAYLVGGCVRDLLLGRPVHDWDMTTSALPDETQALFAHTVLTGKRYGTVTVLLGGESFEVTTFRADGAYSDGRRPDTVRFSGTLIDDLSRRDFTVNAMAMDLRGERIDRFGGQADLQARTLRCVGAPEQRFREDALRILRALRFSAQLEFTIEEKTLEAMHRCAPLTCAVSAERVREELEKTLLSDRPETVMEFFGLGVLQRFGAQTLSPMQAVPQERLCRWAALLLAAPGLSLAALRLDKKTVQCCEAAVCACQNEAFDIPALYAARGEVCARAASILSGRESEFARLRAGGHLLTMQDLAARGSDFSGFSGKQIGWVLGQLLTLVQKDPTMNRREALLETGNALLRQAPEQ
ncbi:MAG: hypothetical protein PHS97_00270 [Oscillospiraceae bacterium]|nr:hypothetical protein [Oscillospiraceae bacterium]